MEISIKFGEITCAGCGATFRTEWRTRKKRFCATCAKARAKESHRWTQIRAGLRHAEPIRKQCVICGQDFRTTRIRTLTCSDECGRENRRRKDNAASVKRYRRDNPGARPRSEILQEAAARNEVKRAEVEARKAERELEWQRIREEKERKKQENIA